jgi:surface antigen
MNFKKISSALVTAALIASGSITANAISFFTPLTQVAQASTYCKDRSFTARALFQVNVRAERSTSSRIVKVLSPGTYGFTTWEEGQFVNDYWTGKPDNMWFRLADGSGWVASAVISGYPPTGCPTAIGNGRAEGFFRWALGQRGIARLDMNGLRGQCVTLAVRYLQEVYFTGSERTRFRAYGHGKDVAAGVARQHPNLFEGYTRNGLPRRGAIISFPGPNREWGHVGIVMEARVFNGIRQIRMLESNWDSRAENSTVRIGGWVNIDGWNAYGGTNGWTNPR